MTKLEQMTPEQESAVIEFRERWRAVGLCTDAADRPRAEAAINTMLDEVGQPRRPILWFSSPAMCALAINELTVMKCALRSIRSDGEVEPGHLRDQLGDQLRDQLRENAHLFTTYWWGQQDASWIAFYLFPRDVLGISYPAEVARRLDLHAELAQSANWLWPCEDFIVCSERPEHVNFDTERRLHDENGAAVRYRDGWGVHAWHGVRVTPEIIAGDFTAGQLLEEGNAEIRRCMFEVATEKKGARWLIDSMDAKAICVDTEVEKWWVGARKGTTATLWDFGDLGDDDGNPRVMVELMNGSQEPDGHYKTYLLRVPWDVNTPREAVAALNYPDLSVERPMRRDVVAMFGEGAERYVEINRT